jgi:MFS family permease
MRPPKGLGGLAIALSNPNFRLYTFASIPTLLGTWIQRVAVGWLAWQLTGSGAWLGAIAFADMFPVIVCTPVAGAFADRLDRLRVSRVLQYGLGAQAVLLAGLVIAGLMTIELLVFLTFLQGILQAIFHPFRQALVANMVEERELHAAIAINSMMWHGARFVGPAIAGVALVSVGAGVAIALNAAAYVPYVYALHRIRVRSQATGLGRPIRAIPREIAEAVRFATSHPAIGPMFVVLFAISLAGRATSELLPGFASAVFDRGAMGLAWLTSAAGLGAMLGALWMSQRSGVYRMPGVVIGATAVLALALAGFVATDWFWIAAPCLAASAFALTLGGIGTQTVVQSSVPEEIRGRVLGLYGLLWLGCPAVGALGVGALSDVTGLRVAVAGITILPALDWLWVVGRGGVIVGAVTAHPRLRQTAESGAP